MKTLAFHLTQAEVEALETLATFPAAWCNFDRRTREALFRKGYVTTPRFAVLTPKGQAAVTLTRASRHVNDMPEGEGDPRSCAAGKVAA